MAISRHQREAEALAARLRRQNAAGGKRQAKIKAPRLSFKRPGGRASKNSGSWKSRGKSPASIVKIHKGGLEGDRYAESAKGAEFLHSNMLGRNWRERVPEWDIDQARHPAVKHLFCHASISLAGGKKLMRDEWSKFVRDWLRQIGAEDVNYIVIRHTNAVHDHAHIVFSRALPNGKLLSTAHNFHRWREALRRAEELNGLESFDIEKSAKETMQSDTQVNAMRRAIRRGTATNFIKPELIQNCLARSTDMDGFAIELKKVGIEVRVSRRNDGEARGLIFRSHSSDEFLAGSSISRELTLPKIQAALLLNHQRRAVAHQIQNQQRAAELARANWPNHPRERG